MKHILITTDARDDAAAQKLAKDVYAKIQGGLSFAQAAAQFSEDPTSKTKGGLVEAYAPGVFSDAFDKTVLSLKNGQISQPVKHNMAIILLKRRLRPTKFLHLKLRNHV